MKNRFLVSLQRAQRGGVLVKRRPSMSHVLSSKPAWITRKRCVEHREIFGCFLTWLTVQTDRAAAFRGSEILSRPTKFDCACIKYILKFEMSEKSGKDLVRENWKNVGS